MATKKRVFDAAEKIFAQRGYDGATIRDIADEAGEPLGTIHHHGGGKKTLFYRTVARRAETLSLDRLDALNQVCSNGTQTLESVLTAFIRPFFDLAVTDPNWRDYARLVAFVSADHRWREISKQCFDPIAEMFLDEITKLLPEKSKKQVAEGFVFSVSAMLALLTAQDRFGALGAGFELESTQADHLVAFCTAGFQV
ncbi:hypothetical protein GCM10008927_08020 [Amylibacter ulvae]|uniref:HTH tetR-type domain-containing protein n=1 Tax=Paramylibacter ulvae TaxID=1651968 RepID=A0ABQ3CV57_9RHOB|nr:hypothetical protein GCM10008927_08020 [Amylibacter ulvae]